MRLSWRFILAAALLLAACRSEPIQFHTLTPGTSVFAVTPEDIGIQIEMINIPPQVDRQQIVVRQSTSRLAILEGHWWSATLVDELRSALMQRWNHSDAARRLSVRLDVQRLDSIPGRYALIDVQWRLREPGVKGKAILHCHTTVQTAAGESVDDIMLAQQENLQQLATEILFAASNAVEACPSRR